MDEGNTLPSEQEPCATRDRPLKSSREQSTLHCLSRRRSRVRVPSLPPHFTRSSLSESNREMQFLEDPQFLPFEHRRVHHRLTHGSGDGKSSMRSAMTRRLFHARTVRQRTALPVAYVPPKMVSQSVMKFPSASCALAVRRKDTMEAIPVSSSVLMGSSTTAMRWNAAVLPIISSAPSHRTKSSL